jgi:flavin reductase (DIM6/NTAB) family NADH-FMN oxidoreductase RutF
VTVALPAELNMVDAPCPAVAPVELDLFVAHLLEVGDRVLFAGLVRTVIGVHHLPASPLSPFPRAALDFAPTADEPARTGLFHADALLKAAV